MIYLPEGVEAGVEKMLEVSPGREEGAVDEAGVELAILILSSEHDLRG